ncbi:MAG: GTPase Era [Gammaproteobacteria bacterium]|nr:GTPase Era [Gammaproteobacteria bacterium]|tara:strand:+ start:686 stop:1594 length:909 start_codon:yes stop_codon:yes gene_type:complete
MHKQYCGYVSIIGKPNVGKSTLINTMLDKKISITSRKSQTTRNNILGIRTIENKQIIFIDTPGMHIKSQKTMNKVLNKSAQGIIDDSDIILFVLQRLTLGDEDKLILEKLTEVNPKTICVINKIDQVEDKNKLLPFIEKLNEEYAFEEIHMISAKNNDGVDNLITAIEKYLPENNHIYDDNFKLYAKNDSFMFSELIREKIIRKLGDELPHDTFVEIDLIKEKKDITEIHAIIYVTRQSQKQIVIGSGGEVLKQIGKQARLEIEKYLNKKVFLKTWVKVKKNWNTDSSFIQSLGVGGNYESK